MAKPQHLPKRRRLVAAAERGPKTSRFISNAHKGGDLKENLYGGSSRKMQVHYLLGKKKSKFRDVARKEAATGPSSWETNSKKPAIVTPPPAEGLNRAARRALARAEAAKANRSATSSSHTSTWRTPAAKRRLSSVEVERSEEEWARKKGAHLKYNYFLTHPSWLASKRRRREERRKMKEYGINIYYDGAGREPPSDEDDEYEDDGEGASKEMPPQSDGSEEATVPERQPCPGHGVVVVVPRQAKEDPESTTLGNGCPTPAESDEEETDEASEVQYEELGDGEEAWAGEGEGQGMDEEEGEEVEEEEGEEEEEEEEEEGQSTECF